MALSKISNDMFTTISRPNSKPIIINGNQSLSQRTTSVAMSNGIFCTDRYKHAVSNDGAATITQESLSSGSAFTDGFANALKIDVTTADSSLSSAQHYFIRYSIEGQDIQNIKKGTASAEKLTLAFWVKATKTGTNVVRIYTADSDRSCSVAYTVSSSDTWEKKILNFPVDTTGTVIADDNTVGMQIDWGVAAGSNYTSGTLATAWASNTSANDFVGQVNNLDSTSNNFHITGIQLEIGEFSSTSIPPFQHESFGDNLARCQRYAYEVVSNESAAGNAPIGVGGAQYNSGQMQFSITFPVPMRTNPSLTCSSASNNYSFIRNDAADNFDDFVIDKANSNMAECKNSSDMSGTAGHSGVVRTANSSLSVLFTAEL
jgi:hypothetical protein